MPQAHPTPDQIGPAPDAPVRGMTDYKPSVEQNVVRLSGNTTLKIDKLMVSDTGVDTVSDTELDLQKGRIFASVKKLNGASQYLVKIPNGIAGVRGTKFGLGADGMCAVIKNSVLLSTWWVRMEVRSPFWWAKVIQFNPGTGQDHTAAARTRQPVATNQVLRSSQFISKPFHLPLIGLNALYRQLRVVLVIIAVVAILAVVAKNNFTISGTI